MQTSVIIRIYTLAADFYRSSPMLAVRTIAMSVHFYFGRVFFDDNNDNDDGDNDDWLPENYYWVLLVAVDTTHFSLETFFTTLSLNGRRKIISQKLFLCYWQISSLQHNITRSFCVVLVLWNLISTPYSFLFVTSSLLLKKGSTGVKALFWGIF